MVPRNSGLPPKGRVPVLKGGGPRGSSSFEGFTDQVGPTSTENMVENRLRPPNG